MTYNTEARGGTFEIGRVIERTFGVIGRNFVPFFLLTLIFRAIPDVAIGLWRAKVQASAFAQNFGQNNGFQSFSEQSSLIMLASVVVGVITAFVLQAALLRGTVADLGGKRASFGDMLSTGFQFFLPLLGLAIVFGLAVAVGLIIFIVPGVMLMVAWCAAAPSIVAEKKGVFESLGRSADLTRGHRWPIFGLFVIYVVVSWVISAIGGVFMIMARGDIGAMMIAATIFTAVVGSLGALIGGAGSASIYYELRTIKEGVGADKLASVFD